MLYLTKIIHPKRYKLLGHLNYMCFDSIKIYDKIDYGDENLFDNLITMLGE